MAEQSHALQPEVPSYGVEIGHEPLGGPRPGAPLRPPAATLVPADDGGPVGQQLGHVLQLVPQSGPAVAQHEGPALSLSLPLPLPLPRSPQPYTVVGRHCLRHGAESARSGTGEGPGKYPAPLMS